MKKRMSYLLCAILVTTGFAFFGPSAVAEEPGGDPVDLPERGGFVTGEGHCFEVRDSTYLSVTLCSNKVVNVTLESIPSVVSFTIKTKIPTPFTSISMS